MYPFRVFVGSTFDDLQLYRVAVMQTLHKLEVAVVGMESFGSQPDAPLDACIAAVGKCQAYIGIFAMRYGSTDPLSGKSITQLEYEEAQRLKLPSLIYLLDEEHQPILPKFVDTGTSAAQLKELKNSLKMRHLLSFFTTPDDLAKRIVLDLPAIAQHAGVEVQQSELAKIVAAIPRVDWLSEDRLAFLERELGPLAAEVSNRDILREVLEFLLSGDKQAAVFLLGRTSHPDIRKAIDFAMQVDSVLREVILRGMRNIEERGGSQSISS
jgi:hypothetical protein